jgi:hypothetical protein
MASVAKRIINTGVRSLQLYYAHAAYGILRVTNYYGVDGKQLLPIGFMNGIQCRCLQTTVSHTMCPATAAAIKSIAKVSI